MGLFGGIGKALLGESPSTDFQTGSNILPEQREVTSRLRDTLARGDQLPGGIASPDRGAFRYFDEPIVGGLSSLESLSLEGIEQMMLGLSQGTGGESEVVTGAQGKFTELLQEGPQDFEDYFQSAIAQPLIEQFNEEILPEVSARNAAGFFSSERLKQDERVTEDLSEALAGQRGKLGFDARESSLDRIVQLLGLTDEVAGAGLGLAERGLAAGAVPREVETSQRLAQYEEFLRGQGFDQNLINQMIKFSTANTQETIGVAKGGSSGLLGPFLGAISQGGGGGGSGGGGGTLP